MTAKKTYCASWTKRLMGDLHQLSRNLCPKILTCQGATSELDQADLMLPEKPVVVKGVSPNQAAFYIWSFAAGHTKHAALHVMCNVRCSQSHGYQGQPTSVSNSHTSEVCCTW